MNATSKQDPQPTSATVVTTQNSKSNITASAAQTPSSTHNNQRTANNVA